MSKFTSQLSNLPQVHSYITGHNEDGTKAIFVDKRSASWTHVDNMSMGFHVAYTTSQFPLSMEKDEDLKNSDSVVGSGKLGLVNEGGTVCRFVDFAPGSECAMHRTQSLDYGVVLEGSIELLLDGGEGQSMYRGDIAIQRHTNHAWRNASKTDWARMMFVLQASKPLNVGGTLLEDNSRTLFQAS